MIISTTPTHAQAASRTTAYNQERRGELQRVLPGVFVPSGADYTQANLMQWLNLKQPQAVMNLISALWHHGVTLQIPDTLSVAAPRGTHVPAFRDAPLQVWYTDAKFLQDGVEEVRGEYGSYRVTTLERTLVDCFKYRNKLGLDIFIEALEMAGSRINPWELQRHAVALRQFNNILPYLKRR